jgi:hypothetical protein
VSLFTITTVVEMEQDGEQVIAEISRPIEAGTMFEAIEIARELDGISLDGILRAEFIADKVWRRSDVKKQKGQA